MKRLASIVALIAILAAGCRAEVRLLLDVAENGTGALTAEVGIDEQLRGLIDQLAGDTDAIISGLDLGLEGERETRVEEDLTVYATSVDVADVTAVQDQAAGNFTSYSLELSDEGTSLEATLDLAGELDLSQFPVDPNTIDPTNLQARLLVSLPGEPTEHNADEILNDGRLAWDIPLTSELYVFAQTEYPTSGFPWWLVGLLALTGGLALAVWLAAVRRDRKTAQITRPTPQPPTAPTPSEPEPESPFFDMDD